MKWNTADSRETFVSDLLILNLISYTLERNKEIKNLHFTLFDLKTE